MPPAYKEETRLLESRVASPGEWFAWDWNNRHPDKWLGKRMKLLGVDEATLPELLPVSRDAMSASYPELQTDFARISAVAACRRGAGFLTGAERSVPEPLARATSRSGRASGPS